MKRIGSGNLAHFHFSPVELPIHHPIGRVECQRLLSCVGGDGLAGAEAGHSEGGEGAPKRTPRSSCARSLGGEGVGPGDLQLHAPVVGARTAAAAPLEGLDGWER